MSDNELGYLFFGKIKSTQIMYRKLAAVSELRNGDDTVQQDL